ncbi:hypothetical protein L1987_24244 [Smallanthus sonchifolius]|uniref:Uncharacterized protein n=1 Tax=Smallanthus sonchifolius TaxID=185202 RepID=A0ACB9ILN4_9ASTR|nr:hypothetical protein L1987_24244 [Smallanthus sonchifolius]
MKGVRCLFFYLTPSTVFDLFWQRDGGDVGAGLGFRQYSHVEPVLVGERTRNFLDGSLLTTGLIVTDGMIQSANASGWSELLIESSYPDFQGSIKRKKNHCLGNLQNAKAEI